MVQRVEKAKSCDAIVIITTDQIEDDIIVNLCIQKGWPYYRGSSTNLLDRHFNAASHFKADHVVKIPSDCPLVDPSIIDNVVLYYFKNDLDYASNLHPQSYPDGNDVEIMSLVSLTKAFKHATKDFELEHTTPYIWNNPNEFRLGNVKMNETENLSEVFRYTLDYIEDYHLIAAIFEKLYNDGEIFSMKDIISLLKNNNQLVEINKQHIGVNWYKPYLNELNLKTN